MKKIFYILASAIVALGAVACDNQDLDNIAPGVGGDSLSFSATIDNTKTDLNENNATVWVENDVVVFEGYEEFEFVYDGSANFTCTTDGVTKALGQAENLTAWYNKDGIDSTKGTAGAQLKAEGCSFKAQDPSFKFAVQNAFLKFTAAEGVVLTATEGLFGEDTTFEVTAENAGENYVAINPVEATISYTINGEEGKSKTLTFQKGVIYNLGALNAPIASDDKGNNYTDLATAFSLAESGSTITLAASVELDAEHAGLNVASGKTLTLNLNGKTITGTSVVESTSALIKNNGTLTLLGDGFITYETNTPSATNGYASNAISNYGTLVVGGNVTIENTTIGGACYAIDNYPGATCTIKDNATVKAAKTAVRIFNREANKNTTLNVEGGTILSEDGYAINTNTGVAPNYTINISGGTITTNNTIYNFAVYMCAAEGATDGSNYKFNVTGGTFNGWFAINDHSATIMEEGNVSISGGTFNTGVYAYATPAVKFITGGVFAYNFTEDDNYLADGYVTYKDGKNYVVATFAAAVAADAEKITVYDEIDLAKVSLDGYTGTIVGASDKAVLNTRNYNNGSDNEFYPIHNSEITFKDIDIWFPTEDGNYLLTGIVSSSTLTFNNCDFEGQFTLNGNGTWDFNECNFVSPVEGAYASFVYGATKATFTKCSFSGVDRAAKVYGSGGKLDVVYDECTFTSTTQNKAAVNVDATYATITVALNNGCKQTGMGELYALVGNNGVIYIDGEQVAPISYVAKVGNTSYTTLEDAIAAANGATIELLADATVSAACQINKNGYNLTVTGNFLALKNYNNANGYYDVVAVTEADWHIVGNHTSSTWQNTVKNTKMYRIGGNGAFIAKGVKLPANAEIKFVQGTINWDTTKGATSTNAITIGSAQKYGDKNIKVANAGTYDIYMLDAETGYKVVEEDDKVVYAPVKGENTKLYLNPNIWDMLSARFAAYFYGNGEKWVSMTDADGDGVYEVTIPTDKTYPYVIFVRMNPDKTTNNWDNKWNQTKGDNGVKVNGNEGKVMKITSWDNQTTGWSQYE